MFRIIWLMMKSERVSEWEKENERKRGREWEKENERKGMSEDESQVFFNCQYLLSGWWVIDDASQFTIEGEKWVREWIFSFQLSLPLNLVKGKRDMSRMPRRMSNQQVKWLFCLTLVNLVLFGECTDNESDGERKCEGKGREERWCCGRRKILSGEKWGKKVLNLLELLFLSSSGFGFFLPCKIFQSKSGCRFQLQFLVDG